MISQITKAQLDAVTGDYNRAFALQKQLASKGLIVPANRYMDYVNCIERTMCVLGFIPVYNHEYDPYTGENFISGWKSFTIGEDD